MIVFHENYWILGYKKGVRFINQLPMIDIKFFHKNNGAAGIFGYTGSIFFIEIILIIQFYNNHIITDFPDGRPWDFHSIAFYT